MATAWYDGAILDCAIAYNILLHQQDQALRGVSPHVPLEERERLRTLGLGHYLTSSQLSYSCGTRWPVGNETVPYRGAWHLLPSVKHVLLHIGQHQLDQRNDGRLLRQCHCHSHVSSPFWPLEVVPFTNEDDDDTGQDYLCPKNRAPVSPIVTRPSTLDLLDILRQVVVLPPFLTRKVETLSLFCDVWRRRKCSE